MRILTLISGISLLFSSSILSAQSELYIPREFQNAYEKNTRSKDGKPGINYWQNHVAYDIEVEVAPETRKISGKETVVFSNNSPDDLRMLIIRLYYDVFKKGNERGMAVNEEDLGEGVILKKLLINGDSIDLTNRNQAQRFGTNLMLRLSEPLKPRDEITLDFQWEQKIPLTVRRVGARDSTSFFVGYWYPQVAVYDDVFGWDMTSYTFDTEFYNNLADFDVKIKAPDNFLVWATGTLENSADILPSQIHERYLKAKSSKELIKVVTKEDLSDLKLKSNTWHYKASEVSDFAFAMSDHYLWDALSQEVSGKDVLINTAYPLADEEDYEEVTLIQQKTMKHFSEDIPGIPYPYPAFTTFIGMRGGGMEFPMMANNSGPSRGVTIHELFHTYFPMYVRINESRFAWMDEGWATFTTTLVQNKYFSDEYDPAALWDRFKNGMQRNIGTIGDLPTITSSQYMGNNYGYHSYTLPAFTYALLYQHFGEEKFLEVFRAYIRRWAGKSPTPYDFFYTFEDVSGEDLSWFWEPWYFEMGYPDLAIDSYKKGKLVVKRMGDRPVPVSIHVEYKEGNAPENYEAMVSSDVWKDDNDSYTVSIPNGKQVASIVVNSEFPDFNEIDNLYPSLADRFDNFDINISEIKGDYEVNSSVLTILEKDGALVVESNYLIPKGKNKVMTMDGLIEITFLEEDGKVVGFEALDPSGETIIGNKL